MRAIIDLQQIPKSPISKNPQVLYKNTFPHPNTALSKKPIRNPFPLGIQQILNLICIATMGSRKDDYLENFA